VLANEVLDNMPAHVFEVAEDGLREILVSAHDGRLVEQLGPLSTGASASSTAYRLDRAGSSKPDDNGDILSEASGSSGHSPSNAAAELASRALPYLEEGDRLEVRPVVDVWCRAAARTLRRGSLVVIDYGDVEPDLWLARPAGSIVTYRQERLGDDPLQSPGLADITAHVDFSHLDRAATTAGLVAGPPVSQRDFLLSLGLRDVVRSLREEERRARDDSRHTDAIRALGERGRVEALAARGGLGDLLVFTARTA
jgi:SAM-dependent MidA family methyltransferase